MIELTNINKSFGALDVLSDVTLRVEQGEIVALMGPSGAGKTTLLQIAGTLLTPDAGRIVYDGVDVTHLSDRQLSRFRNANIGFVFQFHQLLAEFTACENVALAAMIGGISKRKAMNEAYALLTVFDLEARAGHKPSQMSGGECQRTAIARALINKPQVVFADEPTGSLDSRNRKEICDLILSTRRDLGQTFVIATHDMEVASIADRIVTMADGRTTSASVPMPE